MRLHEVRELLAKLTAYDSRRFPDGADVAWLEILHRVELADAVEAVHRYYANKDANGPISVGELRSAALWCRDRRMRHRRELPAAPVVTEVADRARAAARQVAADAEARYHARESERRNRELAAGDVPAVLQFSRSA